jgi:hypothetical protein
MRAAALLPGTRALIWHETTEADAWVRRRRPSYLNTPRRPFVTDILLEQLLSLG